MQKILVNWSVQITAIAAVLILTASACKKQSGKPASDVPRLTTNIPKDITAVSATCGGLVISEGGESTWRRGIQWDTISNPAVYSWEDWNGVSGADTFSFSMEGLRPLTRYYVRAFAKNSAGIGYGNEVSFSTPALTIGGSVKGGIVFYIDTTGLHGLVCAAVDQGNVSWSNGTNVTTGAIYDDAGYENTNFIFNAQGGFTGNYAALICVNYGDWYYSSPWYLPSKVELNKLYNQRNVIGGFSEGDYWSSTEFDKNKAWLKNFSDGKESPSDKSIAHHVRAIRAF